MHIYLKGIDNLKRREIREAVFLLTFEKLFSEASADEIIDTAYEVDEFELCEEVETIFKAVCEKETELDEIITKYSEKRQFSRIPKISIAILRLAIYEMKYDDKVPVNVAISEAVLLAKGYAYAPDVQFINGLLGAYAKEGAQE